MSTLMKVICWAVGISIAISGISDGIDALDRYITGSFSDTSNAISYGEFRELYFPKRLDSELNETGFSKIDGQKVTWLVRIKTVRGDNKVTWCGVFDSSSKADDKCWLRGEVKLDESSQIPSEDTVVNISFIPYDMSETEYDFTINGTKGTAVPLN